MSQSQLCEICGGAPHRSRGPFVGTVTGHAHFECAKENALQTEQMIKATNLNLERMKGLMSEKYGTNEQQFYAVCDPMDPANVLGDQASIPVTRFARKLNVFWIFTFAFSMLFAGAFGYNAGLLVGKSQRISPPRPIVNDIRLRSQVIVANKGVVDDKTIGLPGLMDTKICTLARFPLGWENPICTCSIGADAPAELPAKVSQ